MLVAPDVADIILANEWILKLLDNRNYQIGGVDPETLPTGATKICRLNIKGHMVDVLSYEDTYTEVDGSVVPFIPKGKIAVGAPAAGRTQNNVGHVRGHEHVAGRQAAGGQHGDHGGHVGEALYPTLTPEQRQGVIMLGDLDELRGMNKRRKEAMASQVIFTNGCIMDEYVDDLHTFEEREVRYYDGSSNPAIYTPSANWSTTEASGKQMISDMAAMISMLTSRGLPASDVLVAPAQSSESARGRCALRR